MSKPYDRGSLPVLLGCAGCVMDKLVGGGNAILLLLTIMAIGGAAIIAFVAYRRNNPSVMRTFVGGAAILALAYSGGVIAASAASTERTIETGDIRWFCGFYLDCHLGMSVERTEKLAALPGANGPVKPAGAFHVLTLRLHNSAKNPNIDMLLYRPDARIIDALGNEYRRSTAGEAALGNGARPGSLGVETKVTHNPVDATIVFDLPANIQQPRLQVSEGWMVDRILELGLIDDENSIFHRRSYFSIDKSPDRTASSINQ